MQCKESKCRKSQEESQIHCKKGIEGILKGTSEMIGLKVTKNVVRNGFLKIFGSVKWLQYLLKGLKSNSYEVAPESMSLV